jgi:choline dehydrogenase
VAFDVVIVGAGAAGCVLAGRLTEDANCRVALVEAGGGDRNPAFRVPMMAGLLFRQRYANWSFETEPETALGNRRIAWPRGKVMGGSSTINGMLWHRGRPSDYDAWAQPGLKGWGWDDVLPRYRSLENFEYGASEHHGGDGPVPVTRSTARHDLNEAFLASASQAGHELTPDYNAPPYEGAGPNFFTIANGERWSAARSFIAPALGRKNLRIFKRAQAGRIVFDGCRAAGVEIRTRHGVETLVAGQVVLSAGTIGSPHLLMLSGIGNGQELAAQGIGLVADRPGVGRNLQDHLSLRVQYTCTEPITLHNLTRFDRASAAFLEAVLLRRGPATAMPFGMGIHFRSDESEPEADIQGFFAPASSQATLRLPFFPAPPMAAAHAFSMSFYVMRPQSRGTVRLRSADPAAAPAIEPNYLSHPGDRLKSRRALAKVRQIFRQHAFDRYRGDEILPGEDTEDESAFDRWLAASGGSAFHPTGTCAMGLPTNPLAVVDDQLNVIGTERLKIVDASVMPNIVSGNTMAPTMMIAARGAELIARETARI